MSNLALLTEMNLKASLQEEINSETQLWLSCHFLTCQSIKKGLSQGCDCFHTSLMSVHLMGDEMRHFSIPFSIAILTFSII